MDVGCDNDAHHAPTLRNDLCRCRLTSQPYHYQPLGPDTIRLLRPLACSTPRDLHCTLTHREDYFSERGRFKALSYCWGDADDPNSIVLNGSTFPVRDNLWQALAGFVEYHDGTDHDLWIDAICINQDDADEKNGQVHQMWRIYSRAAEVLAWLGPEDEDTEAIFECWLMATEFREPDRWYQCGCRRGTLRTQYFSRTWIRSEYLQARSLVFVSGRFAFDRETVETCDASWPHLPDTAKSLEHHRSSWLHTGRRSSAVSFHHGGILDHVSHLRFILNQYGDSQCADARDKIFAALSHPGLRWLYPEFNLPIDYTLDVRELVCLVVEHLDELILNEISQDPSIRADLTPREVHHEVHHLQICLAYSLAIHQQLRDDDEKRISRPFFLDLLQGWDGPERVLLRSGRQMDCSGWLMRTFILWVMTGLEPGEDTRTNPTYEEYWTTADLSIPDGVRNPYLQSFLEQWPAIRDQWLREEREGR